MEALDIGKIREWIPQADSDELSLDVLHETGFFVLRKAIPAETIDRWQQAWSDFYQKNLAQARAVDPFNPVAVSEQLPSSLADIHKCPELLDVMQQIYPNLALFMQRFVIKDRNSRAPVFVHQDFCYDYGWPEKTTVFIPLSPCNRENGGISFYPGTHHLGYLGDAGETNPAILSEDWPVVCPSLQPGDIAMQHTCTWHCSPPHSGGPDRILAQVTFQPASDPSSVALLRGQWQTKFRLGGRIPRDQFFVRSRGSRLRELQAQVEQLEQDNPNATCMSPS